MHLKKLAKSLGVAGGAQEGGRVLAPTTNAFCDTSQRTASLTSSTLPTNAPLSMPAFLSQVLHPAVHQSSIVNAAWPFSCPTTYLLSRIHYILFNPRPAR